MTTTIPDTELSTDSQGPARERMPAYIWLFLAGVGFSMFSGHSDLIHLPIGLDRPLLLFAALLLLLDDGTERLRWRGVYAAMLATLLWTGWSWATTGRLTDTEKAFALADRIGFPFVMFVLGALAFSTPARRDLLLKFMTLIGLYLGLTGIFEFTDLNALVWPHYITDPSLGIQSGRARGPFLSSEPFGMVCGLSFFMAVALIARSRGVWRVVAAVAAVATICGVVLCLTRSAWGGTLVGVIVAGAISPSLRRWLPVGLAGAAATGAAVFAAIPSLYAKVSDRFSTQLSLYDRRNTNAAAERIIAAHPLNGVGWGRFRELAPDWVRQASTYPLSNSNIEVHNVFLSRAAETGLPGTLLWILVIFLGPVSAVWLARTPTTEAWAWKLVAVGAFFVWIFPSMTSPNPYPMPNLLVWLIAGVAGREWLVRRASRPAGPSEEAEAPS